MLYHQMEPPVHSHYAKKYGLDISLLERLYSEELYDTDLGMKCKIKLLENHRSHHDVRNCYTCTIHAYMHVYMYI